MKTGKLSLFPPLPEYHPSSLSAVHFIAFSRNLVTSSRDGEKGACLSQIKETKVTVLGYGLDIGLQG